MEEHTEKKRPGRPKAEKPDAVEIRDEVTLETVTRVEAMLGATSSFWGSIDPVRIVKACREVEA